MVKIALFFDAPAAQVARRSIAAGIDWCGFHHVRTCEISTDRP